MEIEVKIDYGKLKKLTEAMSKEYSVKVGLLSGKGGDEPITENLDMAGLGAVHEFGAHIKVTDKMRGFFWYHFGIHLKKNTTEITIPARSWLQAPLEQKNAIINNLKKRFKTQDELIEYVSQTGDFMSLAIMLGAAAVEQIQEAFATGGFGQWEPNTPLTIEEKGSSMPLVGKGRGNESSGSLRRAVTYEVEKNG